MRNWENVSKKSFYVSQEFFIEIPFVIIFARVILQRKLTTSNIQSHIEIALNKWFNLFLEIAIKWGISQSYGNTGYDASHKILFEFPQQSDYEGFALPQALEPQRRYLKPRSKSTLQYWMTVQPDESSFCGSYSRKIGS